ncbi:MAG: hypothetical protein ACYDHT_13300 [Solirubrobacteraceae bacterium]
MSASLAPERLGAPTTISVAFHISPGPEEFPLLARVQLSFPENLGLVTSGLGLAACDPKLLVEDGPEICPANSRIGGGTAIAEIPLSGTIEEPVQLSLLAGPSPGSSLHVLLSAFGGFPVSALIVLDAELLPGRLSIAVPLVPTFPEGPDVVLGDVHLRLGGPLTYYQVIRGHEVAYHPAGIGLPRSCPRGGFAFGVAFTFVGGERAGARTTVPCPHAHRGVR